MDNFWSEEEGSEWDKEAFESYDKKQGKAKKETRIKYVLLVSGIALVTVVALVLGLVFGLSQR